MEPDNSRLLTDGSAKIFSKFHVNRVTSFLLGLNALEEYCGTLPISIGLQSCVNKVVSDRGLCVDKILAAAVSIPQKGPLLVTANHPTGILDGAVLLCGLLSRRSDVLIVANDLLCELPLLGGSIIPIKKTTLGDVNGLGALIQVRRAWKKNQCVVVFPAGTVSHWQWSKLSVVDAPWTLSFQKLSASLKVAEYRAAISIKNPLWFHFCSAFSRKARLALLIRAFFCRQKLTVDSPVIFNKVEEC